MKSRLILLSVILLSMGRTGYCQRIKDIIDIQGVRDNPLTGIGLVIGLSGTGDSTLPSQQVLANILADSGIVVSPDDLTGGNIAIVIVTADLGPFAREGTRIDVSVSCIGDAKSLQGGTLLPVPLKGLDGQVYAVAYGVVSLAGWTASGNKASVTKNHQTAGRIPGGAIVEKEEIASFVEYIIDERFIGFHLRNADFATAEQIGKTINQIYPKTATVIDASTIRVRVPDEIGPENIAGFIGQITSPDVKVDAPAVVVINERTGTIVVGEAVGISAVAISQGSLVVRIKEKDIVSQPTAMFSEEAAGDTVVTQDTQLSVAEPDGVLIPVPQSVTVAELAKALNAIGATPSDLIAIFNALKKSGALQARLEIM